MLRTRGAGVRVAWIGVALASALAGPIARGQADGDASGRWVVLFRGRDPRAWDTNGVGATIAVPIVTAPDDMRYLRLRRVDTGESLIMAMTKDRLGKSFTEREEPDLAVRWAGGKERRSGGVHLGIAEGSKVSRYDDSRNGSVAVQSGYLDSFLGSGFGHELGGKVEAQAFGWRGRKIPPTDFEVAVAPAGPLDPAERAVLLGPPPAQTTRSITAPPESKARAPKP